MPRATDSVPEPSPLAPRSQRGIRTRAALVKAARAVFERDGWFDSRIADISKAAGVASGSFYTYFESKEAIFAAVLAELEDEMLHPRVRARTGVSDPRKLIEIANREYLISYRKNARLMGVFEQVAQIDRDFQALRLRRSKAFADRNAKMISDLQADGRADRELDPAVAALGLSYMVNRLAYSVYVQLQDIPFEHLNDTVNQLWANALKLTPYPEGS